MWIRYFVTFIDSLMVMLIFFFSRGLNWEKEKKLNYWILDHDFYLRVKWYIALD